jgi:LacI family transcriptional regulator
VSVGTVSNAINHPDRVRPGTRVRVEAAIAELGFVPNVPAQRLRSGTMAALGVVVLDVRNPFFTEMARGIEDRIQALGWTLMLASSDQQVERERRALELLTGHGVAGLIVVPASDDVSALLELGARGTPAVLLDHPSPAADLPSVAVDNMAGGRMAVRHLLDLGKRHIVMLNGPHAIRQCRDRWDGARLAADRAEKAQPERERPEKVRVEEVLLEEVLVESMDVVGGSQAMAQWLAVHAGVPPEAVFCVNDLVAIGAARALRAAGMDPAATAIVGYDNSELGREVAVPLTSVAQPTYEMGWRAADLLVRTQGAAGGSPPAAQHVMFQPSLIVRESTAGPAVAR